MAANPQCDFVGARAPRRALGLIGGAAIAFVMLGVAAQAALPKVDTMAKQGIMIDYSTGAVLFEKNADQRMAPSSMSKMMTLYILFERIKAGRIKMDDTLAVSEKAWRTGGSKMFVQVGTQVKVEDLIRGVIVQSGNDACVALAELVSGSEDAFVSRMNKEAQRLGLKNTQFRNATGLTADGHYMSPRDLATLSAAIIRDFPEYFRFYSQKSFTYNKISQPNRNRLLYVDPTVDGMKTGHTNAAGYCLSLIHI